MAVPDLRVELMVMAGAAVTRWAISGAHTDYIVGDILLAPPGACGKVVPETYITSDDRDTVVTGLGWQPTMWTAGKLIMTRAGGLAITAEVKRRTECLYQLAVHFDRVIYRWSGDGRHLKVDGRALRLSSWWNVIRAERQDWGRTGPGMVIVRESHIFT
ncbi:hypothetical protein JG688_00010400 [Phytophthora aleatoria]|uniref:Uncharacterized protein n=1 Tax=Phytophthora aleatoria TaxID=2496075 RepID=A0A8J5IEU0_9STRA|nr:hypothetical protein JG688_00010400 [Phytophthora aleatoria]